MQPIRRNALNANIFSLSSFKSLVFVTHLDLNAEDFRVSFQLFHSTTILSITHHIKESMLINKYARKPTSQSL